ncbi:MAG: histidine phosphatase family protein, partial [Actinomycetes bacterium]
MTTDRSTTEPTTVVHLVRHGEVDNPTGVLYGRLPGFRLSERGLAMAERIGETFADRDVVDVTASPLERAQQTARPLAAIRRLPLNSDTRLLEAENSFQGLTFGVGDGSLRRPTHWYKLRNPFRPSWGEPYRVVAGRMLRAVDDARERARGHEAV